MNIEPPPDVTTKVTPWLGTGFPTESDTSTTIASSSLVSTTPTCPSPEIFVRLAGGPALAFARNDEEIESPAVAVTIWVPAPEPSAQVTEAIPSSSVVVCALDTRPSPKLTDHVTGSPGIGLSNLSIARTRRGSEREARTSPICESPSSTISSATLPGVAFTEIGKAGKPSTVASNPYACAMVPTGNSPLATPVVSVTITGGSSLPNVRPLKVTGTPMTPISSSARTCTASSTSPPTSALGFVPVRSTIFVGTGMKVTLIESDTRLGVLAITKTFPRAEGPRNNPMPLIEVTGSERDQDTKKFWTCWPVASSATVARRIASEKVTTVSRGAIRSSATSVPGPM